MPIGKLIDVSGQNRYLKSFNTENKTVIKSKILGIIRKEDAIEYKVYKTRATGIENEYLFSGSPQHRILIFEEDKYNWYTLEELDKKQANDFLLYGHLSFYKAITESGFEIVRVERTNNIIPIVDVQMENGCYFSEGILSHNTGGGSLKYYASQRLDIRRIGQIKAGENIIGNRTKVKVVKNKLAPPFKEVEFDIRFGVGIDKVSEVIDLGVEDGIIEKSGSWYNYGDRKLGQGKENLVQLLKEDEKLMSEIETKLRELRGLEVK